MGARVCWVVAVSLFVAIVLTACSTSPAWITVTAETKSANATAWHMENEGRKATGIALETARVGAYEATQEVRNEAARATIAARPIKTPKPKRTETCMELVLMANDKILEAVEAGFDSSRSASLTRQANALLLRAERGDCRQ